MFFAARAAGFGGSAFLADSNAALIETYTAIRDDVEGVIAALEPLSAAYLPADPDGRAALYYEQRARDPASPAERAARLIFLNRTCYNGLFRVNAAGRFNVPHGRYARPRILDTAGLRRASAALAAADLLTEDFAAACSRAKPGDLVYLDPPYHPLSATSSFTGYTSGGFGLAEQERLAAVFDDLTRRGVAALLSNSDHAAVRGLYEGKGYTLERVAMSRAINSVGSRRAPIDELLVSNVERSEVRACMADAHPGTALSQY